VLTDIWTVFWRDWIVLKRRLSRYILSRMISPMLYLVAFGWGLGRSIQTGQGSYLDFIVPGIVALNSMTISFNAVGTPLNMSRVYHKTLEEYLIAPISAAAFVLGKIFSGMLRGLISSAVLIIMAYAFGAKFSLNAWFMAILLLNCGIFAALAVVAAMSLDSHEDMGNFNTYVLLPMSFLCATFFTPKQLPELARWLIEILPLTHASQALRSSAAGAGVAPVSLAVMALYFIAFVAVGIWQVKRVRD
jgi:ABC-type multidrug transport system permease subunit